jgi:hypothetical protein
VLISCMSKSSTRRAKPRAKSPETTSAKPAAVAKPAAAKPSRAAAAAQRAEEAEELDQGSGAMCRSCGKRPGRPTAILGQMTQAELCPQCTALRKERIRLNRAAARGLRSSRLF